MATASTPAVDERVLREATSHVRGFPTWSTYSIFWRVTHLAWSVERSDTLVMMGSWVLRVIVKGLDCAIGAAGELRSGEGARKVRGELVGRLGFVQRERY